MTTSARTTPPVHTLDRAVVTCRQTVIACVASLPDAIVRRVWLLMSHTAPSMRSCTYLTDTLSVPAALSRRTPRWSSSARTSTTRRRAARRT